VSKRWFDLCRLLEWLLPRKSKENEKKYLSNKTLSSFFRSFRPNTSRSTRPLSQREQAVVQSVSPARMAVAEKNERERKKYLSSKTLSSFFRSFRPNTSRSTRPLSQREQAVVRSVSPARMTVAEKNERERKKIPKRQYSFVLLSFFSAKHIPQHPATFSA
jgi:hypothetical protein